MVLTFCLLCSEELAAYIVRCNHCSSIEEVDTASSAAGLWPVTVFQVPAKVK
jgi:hypothetical protein